MKTIHLAQLGNPSRQWQAWVNALSESGFTIRSVDPLSMELQTCRACPGETVLIDGMLPQLSRYIQRICARCSDINVIVVTEVDSFTVRYEVMHLNGAIYVSGPMPPERFVETLKSLVSGKNSANTARGTKVSGRPSASSASRNHITPAVRFRSA